MADTIKTSISVTYTETDIQKTSRFLDESVSHEPVSHECGQATLTGGLLDHSLASNINQIVIFVENGASVSIKVGNTTAVAFTNMKMFVYDGDSTDIFISNPGVDPVKVKYTTGKF